MSVQGRGSLSEGLCPGHPYIGVSVQVEVSVRGGLCLRVSVQGGGLSVQGDLYPGGLYPWRPLPPVNRQLAMQ